MENLDQTQVICPTTASLLSLFLKINYCYSGFGVCETERNFEQILSRYHVKNPSIVYDN